MTPKDALAIGSHLSPDELLELRRALTRYQSARAVFRRESEAYASTHGRLAALAAARCGRGKDRCAEVVDD